MPLVRTIGLGRTMRRAAEVFFAAGAVVPCLAALQPRLALLSLAPRHFFAVAGRALIGVLIVDHDEHPATHVPLL